MFPHQHFFTCHRFQKSIHYVGSKPTFSFPSCLCFIKFKQCCDKTVSDISGGTFAEEPHKASDGSQDKAQTTAALFTATRSRRRCCRLRELKEETNDQRLNNLDLLCRYPLLKIKKSHPLGGSRAERQSAYDGCYWGSIAYGPVAFTQSIIHPPLSNFSHTYT